MNEIQIDKGERLGSDTRTQNYNTTQEPVERCLHPSCSPLVDRLYTSFLAENPQYTIDDVEMYECVNGHAVPKKGVRIFL